MIRVILLTSSTHGIASRVLPELCKNKNIEVAGVVLAKGFSPNIKRNIKRKLKKTLSIGLLGALNGVRMRAWYADNEVDDIHFICQRLRIKFHESPYINCDVTRDIFKNSAVDLGLSLGTGYIAENLFTIPKNGMINLHAEILPDFQGAQSVIWPIYEKRKEFGFTIHQIDRNIDTGNILYQERYPIEFASTLKSTVCKNLNAARSRMPSALSYVCENYELLRDKSQAQLNSKSYTTPSIWQFLRMVKNNYILYKKF